MSGVKSEVASLQLEAEKKAKEAEKLQTLSEFYPDLRKHVGRWNKVAYCSKTVNSLVSRFDLRRNCGCCSDSPLEIWPYLETPLGNVYSDPPCFQVGEAHWNSGDRPYPGWKKKLRDAAIPESIIGVLQVKFERDRQERIEDAEEEELPE